MQELKQPSKKPLIFYYVVIVLVIMLLNATLFPMMWETPVQGKKKSLISTDYCKRRKTTIFAVPLLFMNGSYTHGIRD